MGAGKSHCPRCAAQTLGREHAHAASCMGRAAFQVARTSVIVVLMHRKSPRYLKSTGESGHPGRGGKTGMPQAADVEILHLDRSSVGHTVVRRASGADPTHSKAETGWLQLCCCPTGSGSSRSSLYSYTRDRRHHKPNRSSQYVNKTAEYVDAGYSFSVSADVPKKRCSAVFQLMTFQMFST